MTSFGSALEDFVALVESLRKGVPSSSMLMMQFFLEKSDDLKVQLLICLCIFTLILGLRINMDKSLVVGVGMEQDKVHQFA